MGGICAKLTEPDTPGAAVHWLHWQSHEWKRLTGNPPALQPLKQLPSEAANAVSPFASPASLLAQIPRLLLPGPQQLQQQLPAHGSAPGPLQPVDLLPYMPCIINKLSLFTSCICLCYPPWVFETC